MFRTDEEEMVDREEEAEFWPKWGASGRQTECLGTVAKLVLLLAIVVQAVWQSLA